MNRNIDDKKNNDTEGHAVKVNVGAPAILEATGGEEHDVEGHARRIRIIDGKPTKGDLSLDVD